MRPEYTATDLFRLKKPLKLISLIDSYDEDYVDTIFERMKVDRHTSRDLSQLLINFKDFFDDKLPGLTINRIKIIGKDYHHKIERREILKNNLKGLYLNNRLLPLNRSTYEKFGRRSTDHFKVVFLSIRNHVYGFEPKKGEIKSWLK